jgi:hypothetical protein
MDLPRFFWNYISIHVKGFRQEKSKLTILPIAFYKKKKEEERIMLDLYHQKNENPQTRLHPITCNPTHF